MREQQVIHSFSIIFSPGKIIPRRLYITTEIRPKPYVACNIIWFKAIEGIKLIYREGIVYIIWIFAAISSYRKINLLSFSIDNLICTDICYCLFIWTHKNKPLANRPAFIIKQCNMAYSFSQFIFFHVKNEVICIVHKTGFGSPEHLPVMH